MPPKFKFNAIRIFLTYSRCPLSKEHLLESLQALFDIKEYCIASEVHQDGHPHLHAFLKFTRKVHRDNERAFDIEGFHPNIQGVKNARDEDRIIKYVRKDGVFLTNIEETLSKRSLLGKRVLEGGLTRQLIDDHPEIIFTNYSQVRAWLNFYNSSCPQNRQFSQEKRVHYWIYGPSNTGKTTWLRAVLQTWDGAEIPKNNDFGHVIPFTHNLLYADEFQGHLTPQELNRIADGYTILNTKGSSVAIQRPLVVILSNFNIRTCYITQPQHILDTLFNRFIEFNSSISLPRFPKFIIKN